MDHLDLHMWTCMQMTTHVHMRRDSETLFYGRFPAQT